MVPSVAASLCGFLRGKPYLIRFVQPRSGRCAVGEWLVEMPGIPPILFPAGRQDNDAAVRRAAEELLALLIPEDP
jgi:hypothetical protein